MILSAAPAGSIYTGALSAAASSTYVPGSVKVTHEPPPRAESRPGREKSFATWWQIYEAADRSDYRGYFWIPTLDPKDQQQTFTRRAITERIDFLYKNVPPVQFVIDGLAQDEVGPGLWPKWITSSEAFNKALTADFHYTCHDPRIFSADALNDVYSCQYNIRRMIYLYGECYGQLLRPGPGSSIPMHNLIPGWRIDSKGDDQLGSDWRDGVRVNRLGRRIAYSVLQDADPEIVPAEDILPYHDAFFPGQLRGVSCLASVVKRMFRREDILKALTNGTLARERMGFAIASKDDTSAGPAPIGADGVVEEMENPDGSRYTVQKFFGTNSPDSIEIPVLPAGAEFKMLESNRPGTAVCEFLDGILNELSWSTGRPAEYLFFLAKLGQGTAARMVMVRVRNANRARREFQLIPQFCQRWNVFYAWQRIKGGYFEKLGIPVPADWYKFRTIPPPDDTVDVGREGNLYDGRVATNKMSIEAYHGMSGEDADDVEDENLNRISSRMRKLAGINALLPAGSTPFTYFDVWPRTPQAMTPQAPPAADPAPADPDKPEPEDK